MAEPYDIAVLGGAGFLGRSITAALNAAGRSTHVFDKDDVWLLDNDELVPEVSHAGVVVYLISRINPRIAAEEPAKIEEDRATLRALLRGLTREERPRRIVLPSSGGTVYDTTTPPPYTEESPTRPASAYGRAKLEMEQIVREVAPAGTEVVVARVSNAYGPGQPAGTGQGVVAHWLHSALHGEEVVMFGAETVTRDFVYVDDIASAFVRLAEAETVPAVVNIGAGQPTSLGELARIVEATVGHFRVRQEPARPFDVAHNWLDTERARTELGWKPVMSLPEGIARTWAAMKETARP